MTDEEKAIRPCEFFSICEAACGGTLEDIEICSCYEIYKQLEHKNQEYEELRQYHNKCCKENIEKLEQWLEKYNQLSRDFYNGKYCNKKNCSLLKAKEQKCENYKQALDEIEKLIPKFDSSSECDYGDFDCENCSSLDEEIVCGYKLKKVIKGIIDKAKEK